LRNQLSIDEDRVLLPSGLEQHYVVMREGGFACVCAVTTKGLVGLIEQYRYPLERVTCELPAGAIETGEAPEEAARRELREEAGLTGGTWESMGWFWTMPGRSTQQVHLFMARRVIESHRPSGAEETRLVLKTFDEALASVSSIRDALCLRIARERL
jgi:ADP-ribose pyrophosphatase